MHLRNVVFHVTGVSQAAGRLLFKACLPALALVLLALPARALEIPLPGLNFLPPPPAEGTPDLERDEALYAWAKTQKGTARWDLAISDANLHIEKGASVWFRDAFGIALSKAATPATYELVETLFVSTGRALLPIKDEYRRVRPYTYYDAQGSSCTPDAEAKLGASYPSGHAALGWALALVLSDIAPERQEAILRRGYDVGQSRVICGVHWQSDVDAGRLLASAAVAQLRGNPDFQNLLAKAKEEIRQIRAAQ